MPIKNKGVPVVSSDLSLASFSLSWQGVGTVGVAVSTQGAINFKSGVIVPLSVVEPEKFTPSRIIIELLFVFVESVFVAPRSEELGIAT